MLGETPITVIGQLTADPELRYTSSGTPVASFSVASTERAWDRERGAWKDSGTMFVRCNAWRDMAEHLCESATRGTRVVVSGSLVQKSWEDKEGQKRTAFEVRAEEVAVSLRWATVAITKAKRSTGPAPEDPWAPSGE